MEDQEVIFLTLLDQIGPCFIGFFFACHWISCRCRIIYMDVIYFFLLVVLGGLVSFFIPNM